MRAYKEDSCYIYEDKERHILIDYDLTWNSSTAYNDKGEIVNLTSFFPTIPTIAEFELKARGILKDNPYLFVG